MRTALSVAGSDSVGGAGIQADVKAMASVGVHAATVITAVTAQNTREVTKIMPVPASMVQAQLDAVLSDCDVRAVKTGMLFSAEIVDTVADALEDHDVPLIVDPVMVATVGASLHDGSFVRAMKERLLPIAELVTPNRHEAEVLAGMRIENEDDATYACEIIGKEGSAVLLKGGHMNDANVTDYLYVSSRINRIRNPRLPYPAGHGSGCVLSSYITAHMANGLDLMASVLESRKMIQKSLETQYSIGKGVPIVNAAAGIPEAPCGDGADVLKALDEAAAGIASELPAGSFPEGLNIAYAKEGAAGPEDIAAFDGGIVPGNGKPADARYGAAEHISFVIAEAMKADPSVRCAAWFRCDEEFVEKMEDAGLEVSLIRKRHRSIAETVREAISEHSRGFPDAVADISGDSVKVDVLGRDPADVLSKLSKISN